jgi:uncharacterized protein YqeY
MSTYARIQADAVEARKARDQRRLGVLTLLLSKIQLLAKDDGNRDVREDAEKNDVVQGISRYRKEVEEMRDAMTKAGRPTDDQDHELSVVTAYLPQQLAPEELDAEIEKALQGTDRSKKAMGAVMKHLNGGFRGRFDPKAANAAASAKLS